MPWNLVYEDDLEDPEGSGFLCQKAFRFLGVEPIEVQSKFRKVSTGRFLMTLKMLKRSTSLSKTPSMHIFLRG